MSDVLLERIAKALETIAASGGVAASNAPGPIGGGGDITGVGATGGGVAPAVVTHDMLMALVQPLVQNENTKAQVKSVLNTHGLNRLGEATDAQYPTLYAAFQAITGGGQPQPTATDSLI